MSRRDWLQFNNVHYNKRMGSSCSIFAFKRVRPRSAQGIHPQIDDGFEFLLPNNEWDDQDTDQEEKQDDQDEHSEEEEEDRPRSKSLEVLGLEPKPLSPKQKLTRWQSVEL